MKERGNLVGQQTETRRRAKEICQAVGWAASIGSALALNLAEDPRLKALAGAVFLSGLVSPAVEGALGAIEQSRGEKAPSESVATREQPRP